MTGEINEIKNGTFVNNGEYRAIGVSKALLEGEIPPLSKQNSFEEHKLDSNMTEMPTMPQENATLVAPAAVPVEETLTQVSTPVSPEETSLPSAAMTEEQPLAQTEPVLNNALEENTQSAPIVETALPVNDLSSEENQESVKNNVEPSSVTDDLVESINNCYNKFKEAFSDLENIKENLINKKENTYENNNSLNNIEELKTEEQEQTLNNPLNDIMNEATAQIESLASETPMASVPSIDQPVLNNTPAPSVQTPETNLMEMPLETPSIMQPPAIDSAPIQPTF